MINRQHILPLSIFALALLAASTQGQTTQPAPVDEPASAAAPDEKQQQPKSTTEKKRAGSKAFGTRLETEPPGYVKSLSEHGETYGIDTLKDLDWFDFGLEHRTRFEMRRDDYRSGRAAELPGEDQFLLRSRAYFGVRKILDPLRFAIEIEDARQFNSDFAERADDVNEADILQAFVELHFEDALGPGYPLEARAGWMTLEYMDRRLVGRNRWRSTINAFDGFRLRFGQPSSDWQLDIFAVQPVERRLYHMDRPDEERWFYGVIGAWRGWSPAIVLEPYYFVLDEDFKDRGARDRELHTLGLHGFGLIGDTGLDYDFNTAFQFGADGERDICAFAAIGEMGYTFKHDWKPRLSFSTAYASGDRDPNDDQSNRFDRMFGVGHPWSMNDLFDWRNTITPALRIDFRPHKKVRIDGGYSAHWLASDSDAWPRVGRRDQAGRSGDFVGQEFDLRVRFQLDPRVELECGYAHFIPGDFVENTGPADDADFFYVQTVLQF